MVGPKMFYPFEQEIIEVHKMEIVVCGSCEEPKYFCLLCYPDCPYCKSNDWRRTTLQPGTVIGVKDPRVCNWG